MKNVWKKNEAAVSPVIATILMVAITVVLAAVLYVMVMGMTPPGEGGTPTGALGDADVSVNATSGYDIVITITSLSPETSIADLDYKIGTGATTDVTTTVSYSAGSCTFVDVGNDLTASTGDHFVIRGQALTVEGAIFYLVYEPTGDVISSIPVEP